MHLYTQSVIKTYKKYANQERSEQQKAYMKGKFEFFGLTSPERKEINRGFLLKTNLPEKQEAFDIIRGLWEKVLISLISSFLAVSGFISVTGSGFLFSILGMLRC